MALALYVLGAIALVALFIKLKARLALSKAKHRSIEGTRACRVAWRGCSRSTNTTKASSSARRCAGRD